MAILPMVAMRKICEVNDIPDSNVDKPMSLYRITRFGSEGIVQQDDTLAVEEPLEIRLRWQRDSGWEEEPLTITMRTPGNDEELAAGLLFSEGIIRQRTQILAMHRGDNNNAIVVQLASGQQLDMKRFQRHFLSTSSCGVCGKMAIESLKLLHQPDLDQHTLRIDPATLKTLPEKLQTRQPMFQKTGGVHAAGLFNAGGELLLLREDVGRHNAVDKLIGACLLEGKPAMRDCVLLVSGRAGFELVQKALAADIAVMAAVGAPTSLAIDMARSYGMTLAGFVKASGFNCYSGEQRLHQE